MEFETLLSHTQSRVMVQTKSPLAELDEFVKPMAGSETDDEERNESSSSHLATEYLADSAAESGHAGYAKKVCVSTIVSPAGMEDVF